MWIFAKDTWSRCITPLEELPLMYWKSEVLINSCKKKYSLLSAGQKKKRRFFVWQNINVQWTMSLPSCVVFRRQKLLPSISHTPTYSSYLNLVATWERPFHLTTLCFKMEIFVQCLVVPFWSYEVYVLFYHNFQQ